MFAPSRLLILGAMGRTFLQGSAFVQPAMKPAGLGLIRTFAVGSPTSLSVEEVRSYFVQPGYLKRHVSGAPVILMYT